MSGPVLTGAIIDCDAFLALRSLKLLPYLANAQANGFMCGVTSWLAENELHTLALEIAHLEKSGVLKRNPVVKKTPEFKLFREFTKQRLADKGECECVAWLIEKEPRTVAFVSCDTKARKFAEAERRVAIDVSELVAEWVILGVLTEKEAEEALLPWSTSHSGVGRPADYQNFQKALADWKNRRARLGL